MKVTTQQITPPTLSTDVVPIDLTDETIQARIKDLLNRINREQLDCIVIYADLEHGSNFEYITGFVPRFEEACLVLHANGNAYLLLGNENTKMGHYSRIDAKVIHVPYFSLPNQPMENDAPFVDYLILAGITSKSRLGIVGWKNFTSTKQDNRKIFDIPHFIIQALEQIVENQSQLQNYTDIFISPDDGIRITNNANEIAHYEYGATLAGLGILNTLNQIELGKTELELANYLSTDGQRHNVVTICATGERFNNANYYPRNKPIKLSETFSMSTGYKGGLSNRAAYIANIQDDLPPNAKDYLDKVAFPYFKVIATWLSSIHIGMSGSDLYAKIEQVLPKDTYHWQLNPGHFVADEEWVCSPFSKNAKAILKSGQLLQIDIIPKVNGYGGVGCEDGIALADKSLREQIQNQYPKLWQRFMIRRAYLINVLNIPLHDEVLPLNDIVAYYRPYLLNKTLALVITN